MSVDLPVIKTTQAPVSPGGADFDQKLAAHGLELRSTSVETLQVNVGKLCNQACLHCHVEAGPKRTEIMGRQTAELSLDFIRAAASQTVDVTGGAPELNPSFRWLIEEARRDGRHRGRRALVA